ncbi:MAG TPA: PAS domain-containing sensor histidine kinase, partial [Acidimicrobiales bacterium]|nr:PAS domain-containing sensor histidine kinase [Acidimicrobiales bacterium]
LTISPILGPEGEVVGVSSIARDITEQQLAQATLAESEARLREGEALAQVGGWIWDAAAGSVQWSDELHRIHGLAPVEFDGTLAAHLGCIHPDDRGAVESEMTSALQQRRSFDVEYRIIRPGGETRWLYARSDPIIDDEGVAAGLRGICQDITQRHEAEEAVRHAYEAERAAAAELRVADALKDEFLATVSHELRTPLTTIMGFSSLLSTEVGGQQGEFLETIKRNAGEMARMIERLLDFSRLQAGKVEVQRVELRLADALEECLDTLGPVLGRHRVVAEIPEQLAVATDPDALDRILGNLLTNAAKFSPEGSTLTISASTEGKDVIVSVADEGPGIAVDLQPRIFEPFFQAPDQPAGKRGTGVGLGIVRRYVELQGGRVWCESEPGKGATFRFTVPVAKRVAG